MNPDVVVGFVSDGTGEEANYAMLPAIIVEVLSDATEAYDRGKKFEQFQGIPSFQEYVLIAQDRPHVTHFVRQPEVFWRLTMIDGIDSVLQLETVDCQLRFQAIFNGLAFPDHSTPVVPSCE
ncbi:MAG: Uma2 family endonuclease [Pirellulales bacterium]